MVIEIFDKIEGDIIGCISELNNHEIFLFGNILQ